MRVPLNGIVQSPLNYTGGKFRLLPQILPHFPRRVKTFADLFCGGGNVGANAICEMAIFNDALAPLTAILRMFRDTPCERIIAGMEELIATYGLSDSSRMGYAHYGCGSGEGLGKRNRRGFMELRRDFNASCARQGDLGREEAITLFCLIAYAFNNQIRFNAAGEFNLPVGKRDFNASCRRKLAGFSARLRAMRCSIESSGFADFDIDRLDGSDFVYLDPPYLLSRATYNAGWGEDQERDLLRFMDALDARGIRFALSNVLESGGRTNSILAGWLGDRRHRKIKLDRSYSNASWHKADRVSRDREILVLNYGADEKC